MKAIKPTNHVGQKPQNGSIISRPPQPPQAAAASATPRTTTTTNLNPDNKRQLDLLADYILDSEEELAIELLDSLDSSALKGLLYYRAGDKDGDPTTMDSDVSLLALATAYSVSSELISLLASKCPDLLTVHREYPYEGQTPIHTLVSKENLSAVEAILGGWLGGGGGGGGAAEKDRLLKMSTVTDRMAPVNATVMLGGLPLSVAALTFNLAMVDLLIQHGARLSEQNDRGDTVFHSLVRFSALYPEKEADAEGVMREMHRRLKEMHEPRSVWLMENKEGLTALKLAAQCTQPLLFNFIVTLKGVYCDLDEHDGLFDSLLYDITDICPVALRHVATQRKATANSSIKPNQVEAVENLPDLKMVSKRQGLAPSPSSPTPAAPFQQRVEETTSILEIIYETSNVDDAFKILDNHVVHRVIQDKWRKYEPLFIVWTLLHLAMMIWLTVYAVYKSQVVSAHLLRELARNTNSTSVVISPSWDSSDSAEKFVYGSAFVSGFWAVGLLLFEVARLVRRGSLRRYLVTLLFHHNGFYRLQLIVFAYGLLGDAVVLAFWYWTGSRANNYCLIVALLVGWWFTAFFLRPWRKFSFFTVMVQEVLIGDMLRFSTIFIPQLLAFSIAMHITFMPDGGAQDGQDAQPMPKEFQSVGRTMMTMFKLMLGLADVEVLYEAPEEWLAIVLFVLYVLLTYSLMLNALIALMSNTCSIVSQNRENQWKLQRMAIVLFLQESLWPFACLSTTGQPRHIRIEDLHKRQTTTKTRFVMKISSVRGGDGGSVLQSAVKNLAEGEAGGAPEGPQQNKASSDIYDLMAAMNFQRKQKLAKLGQAEEEGGGDRPDKKEIVSKSPDTVDGGTDIAGQVSSQQQQVHISVNNQSHTVNMNMSYVNIRNSLQKIAIKPKRLSVAPSAQAAEPRVVNPPTPNVDEPADRQLLNSVPEIHPIPQQTPKIVLLPSPCMITSFGPEERRPPYGLAGGNPEAETGGGNPETETGGDPKTEARRSHNPAAAAMKPPKGKKEGRRSQRLAEKRGKFRQRPDSAELEERFRMRREKLVKDRESRGMAVVSTGNSRPGSASSGMGYGYVFPVEESRIHMHIKVEK